MRWDSEPERALEATVTGDRCWYHIIDSMGEPMGLQGLSGRVRHVYQSPLQLKLGLLSIPSGLSWGRFPDLWHSASLDWTGTPSMALLPPQACASSSHYCWTLCLCWAMSCCSVSSSFSSLASLVFSCGQGCFGTDASSLRISACEWWTRWVTDWGAVDLSQSLASCRHGYITVLTSGTHLACKTSYTLE